jgi:hypothetical protein
MLPEKTVLQFHSHEHTEHGHVKNDNGFKLETKHSHCHIDELFNTSFVPAPFAAIKLLVLKFADTYSANHAYLWKFTFPNNTYLRGPPSNQGLS